MIVATAGHIDHGKTALVKALTGIDADRLPEEKKRGITVDLGFAYERAANGRSIGFVDVPGHEKLVRTMLAGTTGVDFVILVVAADDGIMPQTREHLSILDLLGISNGIAVVTKSDRVDARRVAAVTEDVRCLLQASVLANAEILPVSAHRGDGIEDLRNRLDAAALGMSEREPAGGFRLAIDRAFTLSGTGIVVTGTAHAGRVAVGDRLILMPQGRDVRVRALHAQNEEARTGVAGQRCALNITGARVEKADIARGDWVIAPALSAPTNRADVRLRLLPSEMRSLRHWTPVHVHIGAADIPGRISLLEGTALAPGDSALGQILLDRPTSTLTGDRFVVRDQSAQRTIGGGRIVDPLPPARNIRRPERLAILRAFEQPNVEMALGALVEVSPLGVDLHHFALARNLEPERLDALLVGCDALAVNVSGKRLLFSRSRWDELRKKVLAIIEDYQLENPDSFGATASEVSRLAPLLERPALLAALDRLAVEKAIVRFGQLIHLPGHEVQLSLEEENLWFEIERGLRADRCDPPRMTIIAERFRLSEDDLKPLLEKLGRMQRLRRVGKAYFVLPDVVDELAAAAKRCADKHPQGILTVGQYREETGVSRHATMPVLEFFDRVGFTSRHQDGRRIRASGAGVFDHKAASAAEASAL